VSWTEPEHLQAAVACAVICAVLAWFAPTWIARLPEPDPEPDVEPEPEPEADRQLFDRSLPPAPPKELYTAMAAVPRLSLWLALAAAVVGAAIGLALGWTGALLYLVPFVPIGVVLLVVDWRTTLLPNAIIFPTYALLVVLIPLAALVDQDLHSLYRAGWGWLVVGGLFAVLWWSLNAWGYGDVRLAGLLGPALGYLGWSEMLVGLALMFFLGGIGGAVLAVVRRSVRGRMPFGPAMLLGAAIAAVAGPALARGLGY
jgi:leader peptidase (prepilin peptidase)/N-methyltransferase